MEPWAAVVPPAHSWVPCPESQVNHICWLMIWVPIILMTYLEVCGASREDGSMSPHRTSITCECDIHQQLLIEQHPQSFPQLILITAPTQAEFLALPHLLQHIGNNYFTF